MHKGPGNSGSSTIAMSEELSTIVEGRYDINGFDPRYVSSRGLVSEDDAES